MSITNDIKLLLAIQDKNIEIEENAVEKKLYKGQISKFITAKLTYIPTHCACCSVKNEDYMIYKNGTKTSRITLPIVGIYPTYLCLKKQRFFCKACGKTFCASTKIVSEHCFISNHTKAKILIAATDAQSLKDIAKACFVSTHTVQGVIKAEAKKFQTQYQSLPKHLSFDEFKYQKEKMAFEYTDAVKGDIIDILDRLAYGYRNFHNFKNRILLYFKLRAILNQKQPFLQLLRQLKKAVYHSFYIAIASETCVDSWGKSKIRRSTS